MTALLPVRDTKDSEGLRILYSTAPGDVSYEDDSLKHGIFSNFLIAGLNGKAVNPQDGMITFNDLTDFVTREMKAYGTSRAGSNMQIPYQLGESTGDFLIASSSQVEPVRPPVVGLPPTAGGPPAPVSGNSDLAIYMAAMRMSNPDDIDAEANKISDANLANTLHQRANMLRSMPKRNAPDPMIAQRQRADAAFGRGQYYAAMPVYQQLADAGDSTAMAAIGTMYEKGGEGVPKDIRKAAQWHLKAAEAGNSAAMQTIGLDYMVGDGVPQDYAKAARWLTPAAEAGQTMAMGAVGVLYGYGKGVPKDREKAAFWLKKAARDGDQTAKQQLQKLGLN